MVKLNRDSKTKYFDNIQASKNSKLFWDKFKPRFSNKHAHSDSKIILIEKETEVEQKNNNHFLETVEKLNIFK